MIEITESILIECENKYNSVKTIMDKESNGKWMIRTKVNIITQFIASEGILHLWHDGKVVIVETNHPVEQGTPDQDLRELFEWCRQNEWSGLYLHDKLLFDRRAKYYWKNIYLSGIIRNDKLEEIEESDMERLSKAYFQEEKEQQQEENNSGS